MSSRHKLALLLAATCGFVATVASAQVPAPALPPLPPEPPEDTLFFLQNLAPLPAFVAVVWYGLSKTPFHRALYATGASDTTAYSAGIDIRMTRIIAYALGGLFAACDAQLLLDVAHDCPLNLFRV